MSTPRPTSSTRQALRVPGRAEPLTVSGRAALIAALALAGMWLAAALFRILHLPPGPIDRWWDMLMASTANPVTHTLAAALAVIGTGIPASVLAVVVGIAIGSSGGGLGARWSSRRASSALST